MVPLTITPDVVVEFLGKRKKSRLEVSSKSGSAENPSLIAPLSGEWTGTCKEQRTGRPCMEECRGSHGDTHEITYRLLFKPCGTVEGFVTTREGKSNVKGVYNMQKGTVAWRQSPPHAASSSEYGAKMTAEFVGDLILAHFPSQQGAIVGTFLTTDGGFYNVQLTDPEAAFQPHQNTVFPLPTLLTGGCTPKGAATPQFYSRKSSFQLPAENRKTIQFKMDDWVEPLRQS